MTDQQEAPSDDGEEVLLGSRIAGRVAPEEFEAVMEAQQLLALCSDPVTASRTSHALKLIQRTLQLYAPHELAFSFNGGKDSTVLLHLLRTGVQHHLQHEQQRSGGSASAAAAAAAAAAAQQAPQQLMGLGGMHSFVFSHPDDFPEVQAFLHAADKQYGLQVQWLDASQNFKAGLVSFIARTGVKAIILGTRSNDPNAGDQQFFCPSSEGWPPFMRVNPVFDWSYHDVWSFLLATKVPYCSLYDEGYTSLGGRSNTQPNSALRREDGSFAPAHMLADGRLERAGRSSGSSSSGGAKHPTVTSPKASGGAGLALHVAAVVLVGDELLAGKVVDTASPFLCQELRAIGYSVSRVVMLPDKVDVIAGEVKRAMESADVVITCGGIGPTLDDVTVEGVAMALGRPLARVPEFEARLRDMFGPALTAAHLKMAEAPSGCSQLIDYQLENGQMSRFPLLKCGANVFVLPGVPHLMRQKWRVIKEILMAGRPTEPFLNQVFRLSVYDEAAIAQSLETVQKAVGDGVAIGSYPVTNQKDGAQLLITLDSKQADLLRSASTTLRSVLPHDVILSEEADVTSLEQPKQ